MRREALAVLRGEEHEAASAVVGEQHPHFLESLADRAHPVAQGLARRQVTAQPRARLVGGEPAAEALDVVGDVVGLDLPAREDVVPGRELALAVALDQQDLGRSPGPVAQQHQGRGGR
jgi:hypothetical protein